MRVLVVGSGGREHALVWGLARNGDHTLFGAPGNPGMARESKICAVKADDLEGMADLAEELSVDLVVVGPEAPLVAGMADVLAGRGITCLGPDRRGSMIEGSKWFAKEVMDSAGVPTAEGKLFESREEALSYMGDDVRGFVLKADGLAAGKGVFLPQDLEEASGTLEELFGGKLGESGKRVVVERRLSGLEASVLAICNGRDALVLPASRDHKRIGEGDTGPNTGGMGAVCPPPEMEEGFERRIRETVVLPVLEEMRRRGCEYRGVLYAGLMLTDQGPRVLEFNVRFGDPETQAVLPLVRGDLAEVLAAAARGEPLPSTLSFSQGAAACVVMASGGYPISYEKGYEITGLSEVSEALIFHAGTAVVEGSLVTAGGRVLGVTAVSDDLDLALDKAYRAVETIDFRNSYYRKDIGRTTP